MAGLRFANSNVGRRSQAGTQATPACSLWQQAPVNPLTMVVTPHCFRHRGGALCFGRRRIPSVPGAVPASSERMPGPKGGSALRNTTVILLAAASMLAGVTHLNAAPTQAQQQ